MNKLIKLYFYKNDSIQSFYIISEKFGARHFLTFMLFLGMANAYVMRTNMSVAIVAMVNHTAIANGSHELVDDECPDYEDTNTTDVSKLYFIPHALFRKKQPHIKEKGLHFGK